MIYFDVNQRRRGGSSIIFVTVFLISQTLLFFAIGSLDRSNSVHSFQIPTKTFNDVGQRYTCRVGGEWRRSNLVHNAKTKSNTPLSSKKVDNKRQNRVKSLMDWCTSSNIQIAKGSLTLRNDDITDSGLGWYAQKDIPSGSVIVSVPTDIALSVEVPGDGPNNRAVTDLFGKQIKNVSWFVQMSLYLHTLKQNQQLNDKYKDWLNSLPTSFDTPFHWDSETAKELQYEYIIDSVRRQRVEWKTLYNQVIKEMTSSVDLSYDEFVWGCECARSRAFSGTFTGTAFNPSIYAFVLLLITIYVGTNLGTIEQAANGAGVVVSVSILKDFVIPKLFKKKRYIICPMIDMTNHQSMGFQADVSFEYFTNAYSLATSKSSPDISTGEQVYISYGARSNDQLLQYYGFIEKDNPNDLYVMPPIREWDISKLEQACGRQFVSGRLATLDKVGLLGKMTGSEENDNNNSNMDGFANPLGGVVLTAVQGIDPAVLQALRALVSTEVEWEAAGGMIGSFATENSGGTENEKCARLVAKTAIQLELKSKPTTLLEDMDNLKKGTDLLERMDMGGRNEILALMFRIEKKKLLTKCIEMLT